MLTEEEIIALFFPPGEAPVDDCATMDDGLVVTGDTMAEGTHFRRDWHPPELLALKAFHSNLSDLAAGGAEPSWCMLQMGIPCDMQPSYLESFARAFRLASASFCPLIGGDTYRSGTFTLSVTLAGRADPHVRGRPGRRLGRRARVGDALYVTGDLGLSLAGLRHLEGTHLLQGEIQERALQKHLAPQARLDWARHLRKLDVLSGMMDLSDGLAQDTQRFARAADLAFEIDLDQLPVAAGLGMSALDAATSGEEYELLFAAAPGLELPFPARHIGTVGAGPAGVRFTSDGRAVALPTAGFRHFA